MIVTQRERERGRDTGRGRSRLHAPGARCGIRARVSRIAPWAKGRRQTAAPPRDPCPHVFLSSSGLWQSFSLSLFLLNWNTLRSRVFCKISLSWDMSVVYLTIELFLWIIYRDILLFLLYHIKVRYYQHDLSVLVSIWSSCWGSVCQISL